MGVKRYSFGNDELDELLGTMEPGSVLLIEGLPGSGKTIFASSLVYENLVSNDFRALYLTFGEVPEKLIKYARSVGIPLNALVEQNKIHIKRIPMVCDTDLVERVTAVITESIDNYDIVVIDSVTPLIKLLEYYDTKRAWFQTSLYDFISGRDSLLVMIADMLSQEDPDLRILEFLSDIVLELTYIQGAGAVAERFITIKKFRGRDIKVSSVPFAISNNGILVLNYVNSKVVEERRKITKPIRIDCPALQKVLYTEIEPGTSITIVNRTGTSYISTNFVWYMAQLITELVRQGRKIAHMTFDSRTVEVHNQVVKSIDVREGIEVIYINPLQIEPSTVARIEIETVKEQGTEIALISGLEKLYHLNLGNEALLYKYATYLINSLNNMGITIIRFLEFREDEPIPKVFLDWSDITLELVKDEEGRTIIRTIKTRYHREKREVLDDDICKCVTEENIVKLKERYWSKAI